MWNSLQNESLGSCKFNLKYIISIISFLIPVKMVDAHMASGSADASK